MSRSVAVRLLTAAVLAAACGGGDDEAAEPATTRPAPTTTTRATTATRVTTATTTRTPAPTTTAQAASPSPVVTVALDGVLGWWDGEGWVRSDDGRPPPVDGIDSYSFVRLDEPIVTVQPVPPSEGCELGGGALDVDLGLPADDPLVPPIAIGGAASDVRPRAVQLLDPAAYRDVADAALRAVGLDPARSTVVQAVRSDLLGDGTDDVLVTVERIGGAQPTFAQPGDYSVVVLRTLGPADEVRTHVLHRSVNDSSTSPNPYVLVARVNALADLNGDGQMEVVLQQTYYEGSATAAYTVGADGTATEVLAVGCGV